MNYLILWFKKGMIHATYQENLPDTFVYIYEGKVFRKVQNYLGDVDYLRDKQNRLVGFSYILGDESEQEEAFLERLLDQSRSIKRHDGMLVILLEPAEFEIQCVQAIGSEIYRNENNEFILAVPNWDFGELAFRLTTTEIPTSVVPNH